MDIEHGYTTYPVHPSWNASVLLLSSHSDGYRTVVNACLDLNVQCDVAPAVEQALPRLSLHPYTGVIVEREHPSIQEILIVVSIIRTRQPSARIALMIPPEAFSDGAPLIRSGIIDFIHTPVRTEEAIGMIEVITQSANRGAQKDLVNTRLEQARLELVNEAPARAHVHLHEAFRLRKAHPAAHNLAGLMHEMCGRCAESIQSYRTALQLDPLFAPARMNLRRLAPDEDASD